MSEATEAGRDDHLWEIWIDVGGTFTDCIGKRPDGTLTSHKLLSTGVYLGRVGAGSTRDTLVVEGLADAPSRFFEGYEVRLLDASGREVGVGRVSTHADPRRFALVKPFPVQPGVGSAVELKSGEPAPVVGIRRLLGRTLADPVGRVVVRLGTTRGTNALLERRGARTAFVTTRGFADVLTIAYQNRPRLFDLDIRKPAPLYEVVVETSARLTCSGEELEPLDEASLRRELAAVKAKGIDSLAVCLLNAYKNAAHERRVADVARELGFAQISVSTELSPTQRIVPRGDTAVVDAYLTPVISDYVATVRGALPAIDLRLMTSAGSLVDVANFHGKDSVLSGPAGGVVGVASSAKLAGQSRVIGFDMGGTSTDICRWEGDFERRYEMEVLDPDKGAGCRIVAPMLWVETVAAGGGSVCAFDGTRLTVGPRSAGADPGPACYGRGGPLTITDCNLVTGRIVPTHFAFPLDEAAALARLDELGARIEAATGRKQSREALASACLAIAASNMAQPIRKVSIARGFDVREHALVAFGGAGAQHACALADELGVTRVIVPEFASFLSAQGIGNADVRAFAVADLGASLDGTASVAVTEAFARLERDARAELAKEPSTARWTTAVRRRLDVRYAGQDSVLTIDEPVGGDWQAAFAAAHRQRFGFTFDGRRVEARAARVEAVATPPTARPAAASSAAGSSPPGVAAPSPQSTAKVFADGAWRTAAVHGRDDLPLDTAVAGPALVVEAATVLVVEAGWSVVRRAPGYLEVYRDAPRRAVAPDERAAAGSAADPMTLTLFVNRFTAIAEEMGTTLMRTALSVNVKERLDFSCAIFGPDGSLVVNAPHIPVHLGSMGDTVRALLRDLGASMRPGDVYVTNDPYRGGSHLPDVTAVTPVFDETGRRLLFFTGSRAHHAEIGGTAPGSMPPDATSLAEEGVLLRCVRWRYGEEGADEELRRLFSGSKWPSRSVETNIADLRAQAAANALGRERLSRLVETFGLGTVTAYMRHIREASTTRLRTALAKLAPGQKTCRDQMDDGTPVVVTLTPTRDAEGARLTVDFTGTGAVAKGNLNANLAIVKAATLYALRCLIAEDVPLNEGVLGPVDFVVPFPSLLSPPQGDDPTRLAAVNAGNVETSQRLVDVLLGALGLAAASQGTMNNLLFGRAPAGGAPGFGYYETICGGAGAGPGFAGASGVHTHMTNTRITDPEVLEERFPVRLRRFALRHGSGGAGKWRGGDGVVRELEFLAPVELSLITSRRATAPWGLQGGSAGAPGKNVLVRRDGSTTVLPPMARAHVEAGDALTLETPGGGGFGKP